MLSIKATKVWNMTFLYQRDLISYLEMYKLCKYLFILYKHLRDTNMQPQLQQQAYK